MDQGTGDPEVMIVSVLLPSRHRPKLLSRSIRSLFENADDPELVQVIVGWDGDDPVTRNTAWDLEVDPHCFPESLGYRQLHTYFNTLAEDAVGDWLLLWNDDAVMQTQGWEQEMASKEPGILCLHGNHDPFNVFPAVHRKVYEAMGHFSLSNHNDSWLSDVGLGAGCLIQTNIQVWHDRFDLTGNNYDEIYRASAGNYTTDHYYGEEMAQARAKDIRRVVKALYPMETL